MGGECIEGRRQDGLARDTLAPAVRRTGPDVGIRPDSARSRSCMTAQVAIWAREWKPSLPRMLATCRSTVAGEIASSSASWRYGRPPRDQGRDLALAVADAAGGRAASASARAIRTRMRRPTIRYDAMKAPAARGTGQEAGLQVLEPMPAPATRSLTVLDTTTSPGAARSKTRSAIWSATPPSWPPAISHSPACSPARTAIPSSRPASTMAQAQPMPRAGPSKVTPGSRRSSSSPPARGTAPDARGPVHGGPRRAPPGLVA